MLSSQCPDLTAMGSQFDPNFKVDAKMLDLNRRLQAINYV
jgi:hypothetical protein